MKNRNHFVKHDSLSDTQLHSIEPDASETQLLQTLQPTNELTHERATELLAYAAWSRLAEPGDSTAIVLIEQLGARRLLAHLISGAKPKRVFEEVTATQSSTDISVEMITAGISRWRPRLDKKATIEDLRAAVAAEVQVVIPLDHFWPKQLTDLGPHSPIMLWVKGNVEMLTHPGLAIVGARASSSYGEHVTADFAHSAVNLGATIISGAAYGIDAVAHRAALAAGGSTIAVLAGGVDRAYPAGHASLLQRIGREGLVCSEMIPGAPPTRWRFLQRNRVIASLAEATLVTEAGMRSGSLNTAGHTAQLGRPLGAVPGPITSVSSTGCHRLVKEYGAALIANDDDLQELMGVNPLDLLTADRGGSLEPAHHRRILDAMPLRGSRKTSDIARNAGMSVEETMRHMAELDILGHIDCVQRNGNADSLWKIAEI